MLFVAVTALSLLALVHAKVPTTDSIPVDDATRIELMDASAFAGAAYCRDNINMNRAGGRLSCAWASCRAVEESQMESVAQFLGSGVGDATGYVAIDEPGARIAVAFGASPGLAHNFTYTHLEYSLKDAPDVCEGCQAVDVFYNSWLSAKTIVLMALENVKSKRSSYSLAVVGHGLGGAVATVAAPALRNLGYHVDLYSFSSPRVGNHKFARYVSENKTGTEANYRVVHLNDWVPKVPAQPWAYHIADEYYITSQNRRPVHDDDMRLFKGYQYEDFIGGNAATHSEEVAEKTHSWIFNNLTQCSTNHYSVDDLHEAYQTMRLHWNDTSPWDALTGSL